MKRKGSSIFILLVVALVGLILTACSESDTTAKKDTQNIKELVQDYGTGKAKAQSASITSHQLIVTENDGKESAYDLPEDEFFVSIAPFVNSTHE